MEAGTDIDIDALPHVGGTGAGGFYELAERVILARPLPGYAQTEEGARRSLAEAHRIAREIGRPIVLVLAADRMGSDDGRSREVWRTGLDTDLVAGVLIVTRSLLGRAIGSFIIGMARPPVPAGMVDSFTEAIARAHQTLAARAEATGE